MLVVRPVDYRWNSLGSHVQTNNQDNFLSTDFGLKEFNVAGKQIKFGLVMLGVFIEIARQ